MTCKPERYPSYWILNEINKDKRFEVYSTANTVLDSSCFENIDFLELGYKGDIQIQKPGYNYAIYKAYKKICDKVEIIHHREMFQVSKGFNLIPILSNIKNKTFIVGPVELPHEIFEDDFLVNSTGLERLIKKGVYMSRGNLGSVFKMLFKATVEKADVVLVPDSHVKKELSRYIAGDKIQQINYGVDISKYDNYMYKAEVYNYDIVFGGGAIERKGVKYLLESITLIKKQFPKVKLHLLTQGYRVNEYKQLSKNLDIMENVVFHGMVGMNEYLELLSQSRLLCLPTLSEGYGWTILEAMCLGVPVVTTTECRCDDLFDNGDIGFKVKPEDPYALAEAILKLFEDFELCKKLSKNGLRNRENYDHNKTTPKYIELYEKYI